MYTKEEIIEEVIRIREEIGHEEVHPEIKDIYYEDNELTIITPDRPEKSVIIGKGGWVVGKLREKLKLQSIHVISYTDIIIKEYQLELSVKHLEKLFSEDKIPREYTEPSTDHAFPVLQFPGGSLPEDETRMCHSEWTSADPECPHRC